MAMCVYWLRVHTAQGFGSQGTNSKQQPRALPTSLCQPAFTIVWLGVLAGGSIDLGTIATKCWVLSLQLLHCNVFPNYPNSSIHGYELPNDDSPDSEYDRSWQVYSNWDKFIWPALHTVFPGCLRQKSANEVSACATPTNPPQTDRSASRRPLGENKY